MPLPPIHLRRTCCKRHTRLEAASMPVCIGVIAVALNGRKLATPRSTQVLREAGGGALLLTLAHTLSFPGMANLITPNDSTKTDAMFMASRLLIALTRLCIAALPLNLESAPRWRRAVRLAMVAEAVAVWVRALGGPAGLPLPVIDGAALTPLERGGEPTLVAVFLLTGMPFARRLSTPQPCDPSSLRSAAGRMAIVEAALTLRTRLTDAARVAGRLPRLAGFWTISLSVVADGIRPPRSRPLAPQQRVSQSESALRTLIDSSPAMMAFVDREMPHHVVNRGNERWLGPKPERMLGRTVDHSVTTAPSGKARRPNVTDMPRVGTASQVQGVCMLSNDITEVIDAEGRARSLAEHDELTTLPNRPTYRAAAGGALDLRACTSKPCAVIFVDVDRLEIINDTLGHATGDPLLPTLDLRMKQAVRGRGLVACLCGDLMCPLLHDARDAGHASDIAGESGLVVPMGSGVRREAGRALHRLRRSGSPCTAAPTMSFNVSACPLKNPRRLDEIAETIAPAGFPLRRVERELIEPAVMAQPRTAETSMRALERRGVRPGTDDVRTGYPSLAARKRLAMDCVKNDRPLVNDNPGEACDSVLTRAGIAMGHSLGLHGVAEGVERNEQHDFLRREGCDQDPGYRFARPLPEADLAALLARLPQALRQALAAH